MQGNSAGRTTWALQLLPDELDMYNIAVAGRILNRSDVQKSMHDYFMSIVKRSIDANHAPADPKTLTSKLINGNTNNHLNINKNKGDIPPRRVTAVQDTSFSEGQGPDPSGSSPDGSADEEVV